MLGPARGTKVLLGEELSQKNWLKSKLAEWAEKSGFREIETPTLEYSRLFTGVNSSEEESILEKELFYIEGRKYALKPEGTASIARAALGEKLLFRNPVPLKFYYFSQCFRYERPQKGRFREFTQFGLELIGGSSFIYELELISELNSFLREFLALELDLRINYLSGSETKKRWSSQLSEYFQPKAELLSETSQRRIQSNPIRILDDKRDIHLKEVKEAPKIQSLLSQEELEEIKKIKNYLHKLGVEYNWDETLVRGMDYYTGLVFEWNYKNTAIAGGGRYDEFFQRFRERGESSSRYSFPSMGVAIGLERLQSALTDSSFNWPKSENKKIYLCNLLPEVDPKILLLLRELRSEGIEIESNWDLSELKSHLKFSERLNVGWLLIYGPTEQKAETIILKEQYKNLTLHFSLQNTATLIRELKRLCCYC